VNFKDLQRSWDKLGKIDPFWAILSDPSKKNNGWNGEEFFKTGEAEIEWLMDYIASLPVAIARGWALDFGCDQFDLIYSNIVLQHMEARYSKRYLEEFIRTLRVGGLAIFQIPSEPTSANLSCDMQREV
jgi:SAM-dependent methyltransferase